MEKAGNVILSENTDAKLTAYNFDPHFTENFLRNTAVIILHRKTVSCKEHVSVYDALLSGNKLGSFHILV